MSRLCRWLGHTIGEAKWVSSNIVTIRCARCAHEVRMVRR